MVTGVPVALRRARMLSGDRVVTDAGAGDAIVGRGLRAHATKPPSRVSEASRRNNVGAVTRFASR